MVKLRLFFFRDLNTYFTYSYSNNDFINFSSGKNIQEGKYSENANLIHNRLSSHYCFVDLT